MIITYLRSSSYNEHCRCPHAYYLTYVLGIRPPSNKAADKGNIVHKAMELLAQQSKCRRLGLSEYEDDTFGVVRVDDITPEWALEKAWGYYVEIARHHIWYTNDFKDCETWMNSILTWGEGRFDPRNRHVLEAEQRFDFIIDKPWAHYDFTLPDGKRVEGQLGLKGTIDLVTQDQYDPRIIEILDWKTGQRKDWSKEGDEKKTYDDLRTDPQLCLYHYAASRLYPEASAIFITIFFAKDGGPFSLCFDQDDVEYTEKIIKNKFERIRNTQKPELKIGKQCFTFCQFGKIKKEGKTLCQFYADKINREGIDKVTEQYGKPNAYLEYGDGGGRREE